MVDTFCPQLVIMVADILTVQGLNVGFPPRQTCCGQPAFNAGFTQQARAMARHTLDVFDPTAGAIIVPSGSCTDMIVYHYQQLLAGGPHYASKARRVAARTFEFTQFVVDDLRVENLGARASRSAAYHPSCHGLRNLNKRRQPAALLANVHGLKQVEFACAENCSGFGCLFSVRMSAISGAMLARKLDHLEDSGAGVLAAGDVDCLLHMQGGLRRHGSQLQVKHIAEILNERG